jgi:peptide/nickel transport system permease protein
MATEEPTSTIGGIGVPPIIGRLLTNRKVVVALMILVPIVVLSALGRTIAPYDPLATDPTQRFQGLGGEHLLGTDNLGRDLLSRTIVGGQKSLLLGFGAAAVSLAGGVPIGLFTGYVKGRADELLMRLMDIMMSIPVLLLGILMVVALGSSLVNVIIAVGIVFIPRIARVTRSATLSESQEPYVLAAKARGESTAHILFREILPNVTAPIVVEGSVRVGYAILIGTSLSFLGLGAGPPTPDWGFMISQARVYMYTSPWYILWPSIALVSTILSMNLLGDGLRDVLDPKTEHGRTE